MGDESSCDVIFVDSDGTHSFTNHPERPIIKLFEVLIGNDTKQNTVLTNAQIISILHKEFEIDVAKLNIFEIEVFINIIKKYLKDWPAWDSFEKDINNLESQKNSEDVKNIIEVNYIALKNYLQCKLDIVKLLTPSYLSKLRQKEIKTEKNVQNKVSDEEKIVMEVYATKAQLNNLILRHPKENNHIFNSEEPHIEMYNTLPVEAILHWCGINIIIKLPWSKSDVLLFKYENRHKLRHTLVNKNLPLQPDKTEHHLQWQVKYKHKKTETISKVDLLKVFKTYSLNGKCQSWQKIIHTLYDNLKNVTENMPPYINIPADFKRYLTKYNYVRYMYKNVTEGIADNGENYDLQLEETVTPICQLNIEVHRMKEQKEFVKLECNICSITFKGSNVIDDIEQHFNMFHILEPDWKCVNCEEIIPADKIAKVNWQHICPNHSALLQVLQC